MVPTNRTLVQQAVLFGLTIGAIGASFGALAATAGVSPAKACVMSVIVFAGGSQLAAVGVIAAGGSAFAAVASGLLLNTRYVGFGLAVAPRFLRGRSVAHRAAAAHFLIDESAALALAQPAGPLAARAFWISGVTIFVMWNLGCAFGAYAGSALGDPRALGLDAAFPAGILALVAPQLTTRRARIAAGLGAAIAIAAAAVLPAGIPVLVAGFAPLAALAVPEARGPRPEARTAEAVPP